MLILRRQRDRRGECGIDEPPRIAAIFFRTPALSGTAIAARSIKAPAVARVQGTEVKLGALHPVVGRIVLLR